MTDHNRIVHVEMDLMDLDKGRQQWRVAITKEFAPENGGGQQTFAEYVPAGSAPVYGVHAAVDKAREMVTMRSGKENRS